MERQLKFANACMGDTVYVTTDKIVADKCEVMYTFMQYPKKVTVRSFATGDIYHVYPDWHCYETEEDARMAAEKYKEGYSDRIY